MRLFISKLKDVNCGEISSAVKKLVIRTDAIFELLLVSVAAPAAMDKKVFVVPVAILMLLFNRLRSVTVS